MTNNTITNLTEGIIEAAKFAATSNDPSLTACYLAIYDDGTFEIKEHCFQNSIACASKSLVPGERDSYWLTVSKDAYPAANWPFCLMEFCARYAIKITDRPVKDIMDQPRPAMWDIDKNELHMLRQWKKEAMEILPDLQAIGKELDLKIGQSVSKNILPVISSLKNKTLIHS